MFNRKSIILAGLVYVMVLIVLFSFYTKKTPIYHLDIPEYSVTMAELEQGVAHISKSLQEADFDDVETYVEEHRDQKVRTSDGYNASAQILEMLAIDSTLLPFVEKWLEGMPNSSVPYVICGDMHVQIAWKHRGGGYVNTVTDLGWDGFQEHLELAQGYYERALEVNPDDYLVYGSMVYLAMCIGDCDLLDEAFASAISLNPHFPEVYGRKAFALYPRWGGSRGEVESFIEKARELGPPFTMEYYDWLYDEYEDDVKLSDSKMAKEVERIAREYLNYYPDSARARHKLAVLLYDHDKKSEAEGLIREALQLDPHSTYFYKLAQYAHFRKDEAEAIVNIDKAIDLDPYTKRNWVLKGRIQHYLMEDYAAAVETYNETLVRWPNSYTTIRRRGDAHLLSEDFDSSIADYEAALTYSEDYSLAYYGLGKAYLRKGMLLESEAAFERTVELKPSLRRKIEIYVDYYSEEE